MLYEEGYFAAVQQLLKESKKAEVAVAFIGTGAAKTFPKGISCKVVCNLDSGATNPDEVRKLIKKGIKVRNHPDLHAKVFIGENSAIIGSANLSSNGLGLDENSSSRWHEAGVHIKNKKDLVDSRNWFEWVWNASLSIKEKDLLNAKTLYKFRRSIRPPRKVGIDFYNELLSNPDFSKNRNMYFVITSEEASKEACEARKNFYLGQGKKGNPPDDDFYEGMPELKSNMILLDAFWNEDSEEASIQGLYTTGPKLINIKFGDDKYESLQFVARFSNYLGMKVGKKETKKFEKQVRHALAKLVVSREIKTPSILPISSFVNKIRRELKL